MSILRSVQFLQRISNYSRKLLNIESCRSVARLKQTNYSLKWYATFAPKVKTLSAEIERLNSIIRKGGEIWWQSVKNIEEMLSATTVPTSSQAAQIIQLCGNAMISVEPSKRQQLLTEIIHKLNELGVTRDITYYNALLQVCFENDHIFVATDILTNLENDGFTPDSVTYQHLISMCSRRGDIHGATNLMQLMQSKQMPIDINVINELILGYVIVNDMKSAIETIETMKQKGLKPNSQTFANLVKVFAREGDIAGIKRILVRFEEEEIHVPNTYVLNVVCELAENGHSNLAESLFDHLSESFMLQQSLENVTGRLIRAGHELLIPKLLDKVKDDSRVNLANHCMNIMVRNQCSAERVNDIYKAFKSLGLNLMRTKSIPINGEQFLKSVLLEGQKNLINASDVLRELSAECDGIINYLTLRENVLLFLNCVGDPLLAVASLRTTDIPITLILRSVISRCLLKHNIEAACQVLIEYSGSHWEWNWFKLNLIAALRKSDDVQHFIIFLRLLCESAQSKQSFSKIMNEENTAQTTEKDMKSKTELLGRYLWDTITGLRQDRARLTSKILTGLIDEGLSISPKYSTPITNTIGDDLTPQISELMRYLCFSESKPQPLEKNNSISELKLLTSQDLSRKILTAESKGESICVLQKYLLLAHLREKNVTEAEELIEQLESNGSLSESSYANIISFYAKTGNSGKSLSTFDKIKLKNPNFFLDLPKTAQIVEVLLDNNAEISKIEKFLDANRTTDPQGKNSMFYSLLHKLAEKGNAYLLNEVYNLLVSKKFIVPDNQSTGALVKVHVVNDNLPEAIKVFEKTVIQIKATPQRSLLYQKLIEAKDFRGVQRIYDLDAIIRGERTALFNLAFQFAECGMTQYVQDILKRKGLSKNSEPLHTRCENAFNQNNFVQLKTVLEATRDLKFDRHPIFYYLLLSYRRENKVEEALALWTQHQDENLVPSPKFKRVLYDFLKVNDIEPPFQVDSEREQESKETSVSPLEQYNEWERTKSSEEWSSDKLSRLFSELLNNNHLPQANSIAFEIYALDQRSYERSLQRHLRILGDNCDFQVLDKMSEALTINMKSYISFEIYFIQSHIHGNAGEQYLAKMDARIKNANSDEDLTYIRNSVPRLGHLSLLQKQPQVLDEYTRLAEEWFKKQVYCPMNVLWLYHCLEANDLSAGEKIWSKYFADAEPNVFMKDFAEKMFTDEKLQKQLEQLTKGESSGPES